MQKTDGRGLAYAWIAIATAVSVVGMSSHAADSPSFNAAPVMVAQAAAPSIDKIRAQSQRMKEYRALLADPDSNVRLAALDEMLKSNEAALRELAFDAGFASADQNMRALALRERVLSMKSFVLDLQNTNKVSDELWQKSAAHFRPALTFKIGRAEAQTGNLELVMSGYNHQCTGRVAGQELSVSCPAGTLRLRLTDGAVLTGLYTVTNQTIGTSLTLQ